MALSSRKLRETVQQALMGHPDAQFTIEHRRHYCVTITIGGDSRKIFTPLTPSDKRGEKNLISLIRRTATDLTNDR